MAIHGARPFPRPTLETRVKDYPESDTGPRGMSEVQGQTVQATHHDPKGDPLSEAAEHEHTAFNCEFCQRHGTSIPLQEPPAVVSSRDRGERVEKENYLF